MLDNNLEKCKKCGESKVTSAFPKRYGSGKIFRARMCQDCVTYNHKICYSRWLANNPEKAKERAREYEKRNNESRRLRWHNNPKYREDCSAAAKKYRNKNKEILAKKCKDRHREDRIRAINLYGGKCECCGEENWEFLALDHINGGGTKERNKIGVAEYYRRFRGKYMEKLPGFRILCHNCNASYRFYGYCPHHKNLAKAS